VVLLRLADERSANKIVALERLLADHEADRPGAFVVIGEASIRIVRP
jgi:hypothetical protein